MSVCKQKKVRGPFAGILLGLTIGSIGVLWLLSQMGILAMASLWHYWPSIVIFVGLGNLFQRGEGVSHRIFALLTIGAGTALQLHTLGWIQLQWSFIWPAMIIVVGVWIAFASVFAGRHKRPQKKKKWLPETPQDFVLFGGRDERVTSDDWQGGEATAVFGGYTIDLRHAEMKGTEAQLEARAVFGGVEVRIPDHWVVELKGAPIMGAFEDKTRPPRPEPGVPPKRLIVSGVAIFGGVEIKN
jgi:predicted membrane protein